LLELKISGARQLSAKREFCGEGGLSASNLRLAYEPSAAFCEKKFEPCQYAQVESVRQRWETASYGARRE
jgi:hypothetical protein